MRRQVLDERHERRVLEMNAKNQMTLVGQSGWADQMRGNIPAAFVGSIARREWDSSTDAKYPWIQRGRRHAPLRSEQRTRIYVQWELCGLTVNPIRHGVLSSESATHINGRTLTTATMDAPHLSLEVALKDSIASGTFIDTKFYIFSRREASGRVCSPRALYCNSSVLDTVPSISTRG